jgi:hypothetical protein
MTTMRDDDKKDLYQMLAKCGCGIYQNLQGPYQKEMHRLLFEQLVRERLARREQDRLAFNRLLAQCGIYLNWHKQAGIDAIIEQCIIDNCRVSQQRQEQKAREARLADKKKADKNVRRQYPQE